jgi:quercetin dioxygenase-like cupin family protein
MSENRAASIVLPTEGEMTYAGGDRYRFLATREVTDGRYGLWEAVVPPGGGPPPHRHTREEEGFYVIEGEVTIYADGRRVVATPGAFVNMPAGGTHWFRNEGDRPAKMLVLVAPGGMEGLFKETGRPVTDPSAPIPPLGDEEKKRILVAAPKFGIEILPPGQGHG